MGNSCGFLELVLSGFVIIFVALVIFFLYRILILGSRFLFYKVEVIVLLGFVGFGMEIFLVKLKKNLFLIR